MPHWIEHDTKSVQGALDLEAGLCRIVMPTNDVEVASISA